MGNSICVLLIVVASIMFTEVTESFYIKNGAKIFIIVVVSVFIMLNLAMISIEIYQNILRLVHIIRSGQLPITDEESPLNSDHTSHIDEKKGGPSDKMTPSGQMIENPESSQNRNFSQEDQSHLGMLANNPKKKEAPSSLPAIVRRSEKPSELPPII